MSKLATYLLEANICLVGWYIFYHLALRGEAYLRFNRFFLLGAMLSALLLPLLDLPLPTWGTPTPSAQVSLHWSELRVVPMAEVQEASSFGALLLQAIKAYWPFIYLTGVGIRLLVFLTRLYKILRLKQNKDYTYINQHKVVFTSNEYPVFSFGSTIYWNKGLQLTSPEARLILEHELAHIRQHHTFDLLLFEMVRTLFWFNPLLYFYLKSLREVHEFLADRSALHSTNTQTYASVLLQQVLGVNAVSLSHSFNHSQTKKRITMLYKSTPTTKAWAKTLLALPMLGLMFYTFSCTPDSPDLQVATQEEAQLSGDQLQEKLDQLGKEVDEIYKKHPAAKKSINVIKSGEAPQLTFSKENITDSKDAERLDEIGKEMAQLMVLKDKIKAAEQLTDRKDAEEEIFLVVEEMPAPKGGMEEFKKYLSSSLKHPGGDKEGKVYVEFVISKEGNITSTKVLKGLGEPFDSEAERTVANAPSWNPGKQKGIPVAVKMVVPIKFEKQ